MFLSKKNFILIAFTCFCAFSNSYAQSCAPSISASSGSSWSSSVDAWQSFTADCDGILTSLSVNFTSAPASFNLIIYEGGPSNGGPFPDCSHLPTNIIYQESFTGLNGFNDYVFSAGGPSLRMNQIYSFRIDKSGGFMSGPLSSVPYSGGNRYGSISDAGVCSCSCNFGDTDMHFSYSINDSKRVPTLSQWGLIILALSLSIFGVAVVKQNSIVVAYKRSA